MKISHISVSTLSVLHNYGGAIQRRILEIAKIQARMGHEVVIFSVGENNDQISYGEIKIIQKKCRFPLPFKHFEFLSQIMKDPIAKESDILHFHSQPEGAIFCRGINAKKFLTFDYFEFRGGNKTPLYWLYKKLLGIFDLLLPVSNFCLEGAKEYWNLDDSNFRVVYNGVNTNQFKPNIQLRELIRKRWNTNKHVVLYIGRVCHQKGTDVLIDAIEFLNDKRADIQLVIAGPIGEFGNTEDQDNWACRINEVGGLYLGAVEEKELASIYNGGDVFVMPTRKIEMFGMAAIEAQACGIPVIASDHGGLKEIISNDSGFLFQIGKHLELAECIELLIDNSNLYNNFAQNSVRNAQKYAWDVICNDLDQIYKSK